MANFPMVIFNSSLPLLIQLKPNPNSITINRRKVFSKTQTLGGFVFEHWGEQPREMHIKGRTYAKLGTGSAFANSELGVEAALLGLQTLYALDKRPMVSVASRVTSLANQHKIISDAPKTLSTTYIFYRNDAYSGFFTDFKYSQDAERNPRHYEYEFNFLVTNTAQSALTDLAFSSGVGGLVGAVIGAAVSGAEAINLAKSVNGAVAGGVLIGMAGLNI